MKNRTLNEKIILSFIIIVLIICIILVSVLLSLSRKNKETNEVEEVEQSSDEGIGILKEQYGKITNNSISREGYFDINTCMNQYLDTININSSIYYDAQEKDVKQYMYNILSEKYISSNNIKLDNLYQNLKVMEEKVLFVPLEASVLQDKEITSFLVHGLAENLKLEVVQNIFVILNVDLNNNLFSVEPINGNYNSIKDIKINNFETTINDNENNRFIVKSIGQEEISKDFINLYKRLALGAPQLMYNLLDEQYREKRFGNVENLKQYIEINKEKITGTRLEKYQVSQKDGYTQYVCVDQNNNYYIFRENAVLDYSIILDTYTVDIPEFIEKYQKSSEEEKVILNIQKIVQAINSQDYRYVYSKLDDTFKANNFSTETVFENYMKTSFFENNTVNYKKYDKSGNTHIYNIDFTDANNKNTNVINKNIIMQLKDGTDFVMSFNV